MFYKKGRKKYILQHGNVKMYYSIFIFHVYLKTFMLTLSIDVQREIWVSE